MRAHADHLPADHRVANHPDARHPSSEEGMSLIELLVAMTVLAVTMAGLAAGMISALRVADDSGHRTAAANLAASDMDAVRALQFADLVASLDPDGNRVLGTSERTEQVDGVDYTVRRQGQWVPGDDGGDACTIASATTVGLRAAYVQVRTTVTWPGMRGRAPVHAETLVTPPVGAVDEAGKGHLAVTVRGADGSPRQGVAVTADRDGTGAATLLTDADGCAFFALLEPGEWTVELSKAGYVDQAAVAEPTVTRSVVADDVTEVPLSYDEAAAIHLVAVQGDHGGRPVLPGMRLTVYANGVHATLGPPDFAPEALPTAVLEPVFPFEGGFDVWGGCSDNEPTAFGGVNAQVDPEPGRTGEVTVRLATVEVRVLDRGGDGGGVRVFARSSSGQAACQDELDLGLVEPVADPDDLGARFALPYGEWTFYAGTGARAGATEVVDLVGSADAPVMVALGEPEAAGLRVLYRVNAGGGPVSDPPFDWEADTRSAPSAFRVSGENRTDERHVSVDLTDESVPDRTPMELFHTERWDPHGGNEMRWSFPVPEGRYEVRLYFAETFWWTSWEGARVFDVAVEGGVVIDDLDVFKRSGGANRAIVETVEADVRDGALTIDFLHEVENPAVKAIEVIEVPS